MTLSNVRTKVGSGSVSVLPTKYRQDVRSTHSVLGVISRIWLNFGPANGAIGRNIVNGGGLRTSFKAKNELADESSAILLCKPLGTCWGGFEIEKAAVDQGGESLVGDGTKGHDMDEALAGLAGTAPSLNVSGVRGECVCKDEKAVCTFSNEPSVEGGVGSLPVLGWVS
jgi:hypothetical protein